MDSLEVLNEIEDWIDVHKKSHITLLANDDEVESEVIDVQEIIRFIRRLLC